VDNFTGTSGNDTFNAFVGHDNNWNDASTLTAFDTINGGAGIDTLDLLVNDNYDINHKMSNVEIISARILDWSTASIDFANITGVTTVEIKDTNSTWGMIDGWNVSDAISTYKFTNVARQTDSVSISMEFNTDVFTGTADAITVVLDKAGNTLSNEWAGLYLRNNNSDAVIEVLNVESKGSDNQFYYDDYNNSVLNTVNVTGTAALNLDISNQDVLATVNAAAFDAGLTFTGGSDVDMSVTTGAGKDVIDLQWSSMNNSISTGAGDDTITIGTGKDAVTAGAGNDKVIAGGNLATGDLLDGGDGIDTLSLTSTAAVAASLLIDTASTDYQALTANFEVLEISDALGGDINLAKLDGMQSLKLKGGSGAWAIAGLASGTTIESNAGHTGDLTVTLTDATGTADVLNLKLNAAGSADFAAINAAGVETVNIVSTTTNATPSGVINTLGLGAAAHTTLNVSGNAALVLDVAMTSVKTVAGAGFDAGLTVDLTGNANDTTVTLGNGVNTVTGGDGKDTITTGSGNDTIVGGAGNDTINAGDGNNNVDGGADNDSITTGAGDDTIFGGDGNDTINAGNGVNTIKGGAGLDTLTGGTGVDTYIYTAVTDSQGVTVDVITNFTVGATGDVIDLSAVNAAGVFAGTANGYGAVLTTLAVGFANAVFDSSTGTLYFDANADGALTTADMAIQLTGVTTGLVAANFDFVV
jgi:S-layer protein